MAPRKHSPKDPAAEAQLPKTTTGAGVAKRQYERVRFLENGLLDVERKTGKFFKIARQNQRDSPLLCLPPEIRNQIYGYVLGGKTFKIRLSEMKSGPEFFNATKSRNALALLAVCRQVYAETALLPCNLNTFSSRYPRYIYQWLKNVRPVYIESLAAIQIQVSVSKFCQYGFFHLLFEDEYYISFRDHEEYIWPTQELKSLQRICIKTTAFDHSGEGLDAFLPRVVLEEKVFKSVIESQNPGVQVIMTREVHEV